MGQQVEGGIEKHQNLERFTASAFDVSAKDQLDLMARCWFSLTPNRTQPIEYRFTNAKTKRTESVRITGSSEHGIATIHDQDLIIFVISQWVEAMRSGVQPSRRVCFTPYQFFTWMGKPVNGSSYQRLKDALHRLKTTNIETTIRSHSAKRGRVKQFSWVSEWEMTEEGGSVRGVEVVLAEWLFESVHGFQVLTLDKGYFQITSPLERWLYLYARKATGGAAGLWKESFRTLHEKSASQQAYKHYANTLRKVIKKNDLPGLRLEKCSSVKGVDMLLMERTQKRDLRHAAAESGQQQLALIEQSPLEEAWENVLDRLRRQQGAATIAAWVGRLQLISFEEGVLVFRAPTRFIADTVRSIHAHRLLAAWRSLECEVKELRIEDASAQISG